MTNQIDLTAHEFVTDIVEVLDQIRTTDGIPEATRQTCDHSLNAIHESVHGLALWLRELLEWAPLRPETRAEAVRLATTLTEADAGFHTTAPGS